MSTLATLPAAEMSPTAKSTGAARPAAPPAFVPMSFAEMEKLAEYVAKSGLFPGINSSQSAMTLLALCQADGIPAIKAIQRYHIIEGRPSMRAEVMRAELLRAGGFFRFVEHGRERCVMEFWHPAHHPDRITVVKTLQEYVDSGTATTADGRLKKNWRASTAQMLIARCTTQGVTMVCPGVVAGIYTPEETQDILDDEREGRWVSAPLPPPASQPTLAAGRPEPTVVGQATTGPDQRACWQVCEDASAEANRQWAGHQSRAGVAGADRESLPNRKAIEKDLLRRAIAADLIPSPGAIKPSRITEILADLYPTHRDWLRETLASLLDGAAREAQERLAARVEASRSADAAGQASPPDDDLDVDLPEPHRGREPGED